MTICEVLYDGWARDGVAATKATKTPANRNDALGRENLNEIRLHIRKRPIELWKKLAQNLELNSLVQTFTQP